MKKKFSIAVGLLASKFASAQAIFGSGVETIKSEVLYWAPVLFGIGFIGLGIWVSFNKFTGQNRDIWGGIGYLLAYVGLAGAIWAGYDYVTSIR